MQVAVIVPVLDEQDSIVSCLAPLLAEAAQVIVVDGGSSDDTVARARAAGAMVVDAPRGRAAQMNAGARHAGHFGAAVFVHADTRLAPGWRSAVEAALARGRHWGRFDVRLDSARPLLGAVGRMMNLRSRITGICTGDQAIFLSREAWASCGGFPEQPLMEDVELSRRLRRRHGAPAALRARVTVSARRWEKHGAWRTIALMTLLRSMYFAGASPSTLHRLYYGRGRAPR
ncbi:MAG TPA: TIGR04283 family arsenosugar biosynthesis glycosyltransferase [Burkholderiaceae bacterium]